MVKGNGLLYRDDNFEVCIGYEKELDLINFHTNTIEIDKDAFINCEEKELVVPASVEFGSNAFMFNYFLEKATIGSKNISYGAFPWCGSRTEKGTTIILENTINIDSYAFRFGRIYRIDFPDTLEVIGKRAFNGVAFGQNSLVLPPNLKKIDLDAFTDSNLTDLYLPDSLTYWGNLRQGTKITLHMSEKLFRKMKCKTENRIIIENESLDQLLKKNTFKELNDQQLKNKKYRNKIQINKE